MKLLYFRDRFWRFWLIFGFFTFRAEANPYAASDCPNLIIQDQVALPFTEPNLPENPALKNVYFVSGLAADERLFENLRLPPVYAMHNLPWLEPYRNENITAYSRRMAAQVDTSQPFVLVGMSFGGMVAVEMNKFLQPHQTILISSIVSEKSFSNYLKVVSRLKLYKIVPTWIFKNFRPPAYWFFNAKTTQQKKLVASFMKNASEKLLRWSIIELLNWQNRFVPEKVFLINGDRDRVFPAAKVGPDVLIPDGGHMMVYSKADSISQILARQLKQVDW